MTLALTPDGHVVDARAADAPPSARCPQCGREVWLQRGSALDPGQNAYVHADMQSPAGCVLHAGALRSAPHSP